MGVGEGKEMRHSAFLAMLTIAIVQVVGPCAADEMQSPRVSFADVGWEAVRSSLSKYDQLKPETGSAPAPNEIVQLNTATFERFPDIGASSVPVLLPFDTATFLVDRAAGLDQSKPTDAYLSGFHATKFFFPGPAGYDAAFTIRPSEVPSLSDMSFSDQAEVLISGSSVLYELEGATDNGTSAAALEADFPGIKRLLIESRVRYTFVRYGVPYMVSMLCSDGGARPHLVSCRQADRIVAYFLHALSVVGGMPQPRPAPKQPQTVQRPAATSPDFTYYGPGQIIPGTGMRGNSGRVDYTVYAKIRFPFAQAPAFANSQSFLNWGDCDHTGRVPSGVHTKDAPYHCRVNDRPLVFDESKNYTYPWQDNFCEHRWFSVGQCPAGLGHQGQDIRPSDCHMRNEGADRCDAYLHDVVAVRDGMVLRSPKQEAVILFVNSPAEHLRIRYLHMNPKLLDQDEVLSGRTLREGQVFGRVGNYDRRENGTTYHLHFDVQVPTRDGWMFVNPYSMLVTAYERLIGGRGAELKQEVVVATAPQAPQEGVQNEAGLDGTAAGGSEGSEGPLPLPLSLSLPPTPTPTQITVKPNTETKNAIKPNVEANRAPHPRAAPRGRARLLAHLRTHCRRCGRL
jgi:hypothetical protein